MAEHETGADLWFRYLTKLNDRALNRRTASGLTTWALAAVIAALLFRVLDHMPMLTTRHDSLSLHALAVVGIMNVLIFGLLTTISLVAKGMPTMEARLSTRLERAANPAVYAPALALLFAVSVLNFFVTEPARLRGLSRWPFLTLGVFFAFQLIFPAISKVRTMFRNRAARDLPDLSTPPYHASAKLRSAFEFGLLAMAFAGLAIATVPAIQSLPHVTTTMHVEALKWAMQVAGVLLLSVFLCFRMVGLLRERHLERLERRIVLENLSSEEISNLYVREFLGPTVQDWLAEAEQELSRRYTEFEDAASAAEISFRELTTIDPSMTYEITGRKKEICKTLKAPLNAYTEYTKELLSKVKHLAGQKAFLSTVDVLKKLTASLENQLEHIQNRHEQVCATCKEATKDSQEGSASEEAEQAVCTVPVKAALSASSTVR